MVWAAYGKPMRVSSGVRSLEHHLRVYANKGITDKSKIPMGCKRLKGAAVDISDPSGELMAWLKANESVLVEAEFWCEKGTVGWIHFQTLAPRSGKRWFLT